MLSDLKKKLETSPLFKTIIGVFSLVIFSVLSGAFTTEISIDGNLEWSTFYKARSFYGLMLSSILMYFYFRLQFSFDQNVTKFQDDEYCKAYMRKECLPEAAKKINTLIKDGKSTKQVKNIITEFKL
jgi:hypothetical protein